VSIARHPRRQRISSRQKPVEMLYHVNV